MEVVSLLTFSNTELNGGSHLRANVREQMGLLRMPQVIK